MTHIFIVMFKIDADSVSPHESPFIGKTISSDADDQAGGDDSEGKTEIFVIKESIRNHVGGG